MWFTFTLFDLNLFFPFEMLRYLSYLKWRGGISNFDNAKPKLQTLPRHTYSLSHFILYIHTKKSIFFDRRISNSAQKFQRFHLKTRQITDFQYDCCKRQTAILLTLNDIEILFFIRFNYWCASILISFSLIHFKSTLTMAPCLYVVNGLIIYLFIKYIRMHMQMNE